LDPFVVFKVSIFIESFDFFIYLCFVQNQNPTIMRAFKSFDLVIQGLLIANVGIPLLLTPFSHGMIVWSVVFLFFLGAWQLFSALLLGFGLPDKFRRLYFVTAVAFCSLPYIVGYVSDYLFDQFNWQKFYGADDTVFILMLIISFTAGLYYFSYSYRDYKKNSTI